MINEVLEIVFYTTAICAGITISSSAEDKWLYWLRKYAKERKGLIWHPIIICHWCMPSVYAIPGFGTYFLLHGVDWHLFGSYHIVVCVSSAVHGLYWSLNNFLNK